MPAKSSSSTGLKKETAGALSYVLGPITGVIFLVLEKDSFVHYHAMQSIIFSIAVFALNTLLTITVIFAPLVPLLVLGEFILWLLLIYKASQGEKWEIPVLGKYVQKFL